MSEGRLNLVGRHRDDLPTPVMLLDESAAKQNIDRLGARFSGPIHLRPHAKSHKCAELARLQIAAGAVGITVATAWEAMAFAAEGIEEILVANEIFGTDKLAALALAACDTRLIVAVDDEENLRAWNAAARDAGSTIGVLIDVDVGLGRCGVRNPVSAVRLANASTTLRSVSLRGVMGYEGHFPADLTAQQRQTRVTIAQERLADVCDALHRAGHGTEIVSAGGTSTLAIAEQFRNVTEFQAGSYVLMDNGRRPVAPDFIAALSVLASVVSRHGRTIVLDAGRRSIGLELASPSIAGTDATLLRAGDEHLVFEVGASSFLRPGDKVRVLPGYAPTTINLHEAYLVMRDDFVSETWNVLARGAGNPWVP